MSRRIATPFAQELLDKATPEWDGDVSPSGVPCLTGWVPDASESRGKRHVVIAEFHGANDMLDLALASNAADLARSLIETEKEREALREKLALHEAFVSALDAHEEAVHALQRATPATFGDAYATRAAAHARAHTARIALPKAKK